MILYIHTYIHIYIHTYIYTYIHTHTHIHIYILSPKKVPLHVTLKSYQLNITYYSYSMALYGYYMVTHTGLDVLTLKCVTWWIKHRASKYSVSVTSCSCCNHSCTTTTHGGNQILNGALEDVLSTIL